MTNDLGVWTADDCALVLIDYQKEMFEVIRSETSADLVEMHVRLLAKTAKAFDVPIVLTTVGVGAGFNGPTLPSILSELDGIVGLLNPYPTPTVESTIGMSNAFAVFASRRTCISTRSALVSERMTSNISFW